MIAAFGFICLVSAVAANRYEIVQFSGTFDEARADAESHQGHLATITSYEESQEIRQNFPNADSVLIGLCSDSESEFSWVTGEKVRYTEGELPHESMKAGTFSTASEYWSYISKSDTASSYLLEIEEVPCVFGAETVAVADRSQVTALGSNGPVDIGADSVVYSVSAGGNITLRSRSEVQGPLKTAGTIFKQNGIRLGSMISLFDVVPEINIPSSNFSAGPTDFVFGPDQTGELLPANDLNDVLIYARSALTVNSGVYVMNSFTIERDTDLIIPAGANVVFKVANDVNWADGANQILMNASNSQFSIEAHGNVRIGTDNGSNDTPLTVSLTVPYGLTTIYSRVFINGCIRSKHLQIEPDVFQVEKNAQDFQEYYCSLSSRC